AEHGAVLWATAQVLLRVHRSLSSFFVSDSERPAQGESPKGRSRCREDGKRASRGQFHPPSEGVPARAGSGEQPLSQPFLLWAQRGVNFICLSAFVDNASNYLLLVHFLLRSCPGESKKVVNGASSPLRFQRKSFGT